MVKQTLTSPAPLPSDVYGALEALGIKITRNGKNIQGFCPMHLRRTGREDEHPSWYIHSETGDHHCWSCGYAGGFLRLVADVLGYGDPDEHQGDDYQRARRWVRRFGLDLGVLDTIPAHKVWDIEPAQPVRRVLEEALQQFTDPPEDVMERRHVSLAACQHYGVMWNPKQRGWIFPARDPVTGELWGYQFKRKTVTKNWPMRLRKSETLFGIDIFRGGRAVLVESPIDAVKLYTDGITTALATMGSEISEEQLRIVIGQADSMILALDNDKAGRIQTLRILERGWGKRIETSVFYYGDAKGKDPGELSRAEVYRGINNAQPWWEWIADDRAAR